MFFSDWMSLLRLLVVGSAVHIALVLFLRVSGKRTLAKMNAFDWIVSVAMGSTVATALLSRDVALMDALAALALLILLQFAVARAGISSRLFRKAIKSEPRLLFHRGKFLEDAMRSERVNRSEILQAVRAAGKASLADVHAVVLETDGTFSVTSSEPSNDSAMTNLEGQRES